MKSPDIITYLYKFRLAGPDKKEKEFLIKLDRNTLNFIPGKRTLPYPEWTELGFYRCPNCSLNEKKNKYCPIAVNLVEVVDFFSKNMSYEKAEVIVESKERKYSATTLLQKSISSMIGIYMATSGCPVMEKIKPMARYHLPFATLEETKYRFISMYLLAQHFLYLRGKKPDVALAGMKNIYKNVRIVNDSFSRRFGKLNMEDALVNALVNLDCYACSVDMSLDKSMLDRLELLFKSYFE